MVVQVGASRGGDVELGVVGVGFTGVGHCEHVGLVVLVKEVLVFEMFAIY
jgi:hypothetical protein